MATIARHLSIAGLEEGLRSAAAPVKGRHFQAIWRLAKGWTFWHGPARLAVPDGIKLVYLPPYLPELQPAERPWPILDEPLANTHLETLAELDAVVAEPCLRLDPDALKAADFHCWPKSVRPS